jgi:hypothetical protein
MFSILTGVVLFQIYVIIPGRSIHLGLVLVVLKKIVVEMYREIQRRLYSQCITILCDTELKTGILLHLFSVSNFLL